MAKSRRASLLLIFLTVFIDLLGFAIVLPLIPRYGKHFEADGMIIGLLMASFSAMQFLFAPLWGRLSDRIGRRPVLLVGLAGSTLFYGLFGFAVTLGKGGELLGLSTMTWLFITRIGAGIAGATIPTAQAYIADITGREERGKGMAIIGAAFGFGFTFGPLIGAIFASSEPGTESSGGPGYVAAVLSGIAAVTAFFVLPESLKKSEDHVEPGDGERRDWIDLSALKAAISIKAIGFVLLTMFFTTFAFAQFETTLSLLTREKGLSHQENGVDKQDAAEEQDSADQPDAASNEGLSDRDNFFVFAYVGFILALSQGMLVRRLMPKVGEFRMGLAGIILMSLGMLLIGVTTESDSILLLYATLPICVIGFSALQPSLQSMLSLRSPEDRQGEFLAVGQSCSSLARILGPFVGLTLFDIDIAVPYLLGSGVMAMCILLLMSLRSDPHSSAASQLDQQ